MTSTWGEGRELFSPILHSMPRMDKRNTDMENEVGIMRIDHIALWVNDLELMKDFYCRCFSARAHDLYRNAKGFSSYFLSFGDGCRLELMCMPGHTAPRVEGLAGYAHLALSAESAQGVDELTSRLEGEGVRVLGKPRRTGDGYYESVILDPEGNTVEITG